jgi:hypothetical protein
MNLKGHTREIVLGLMLVVLVAYFLWPTVPGDAQDTVEGGGGGRAGAVVLNSPDVDLALLSMQPGEYRGGGRNLFDYGKIQPPPPSAEELERLAREAEARRLREEEERRLQEEERERLRQEALRRQKELAEQRLNQASTPAAAAKPIPPTFPYKFIGVLGQAEERIAIFLDEKDFFMAQEGEDVKEDFRIVQIGYDTLRIGYTDPVFEGESEILQMGKK